MELKLTKVRLDFEDGSYQTMEGEAADRWLQKVNSLILMATIHGASDMEEFEEHWVRTK
jgi:hypothetical protein